MVSVPGRSAARRAASTASRIVGFRAFVSARGASGAVGALRAGFGGAAAGAGFEGVGEGATAAASRIPSERSAVSINPRATSERDGLENGGLAASATTRSNPVSRSGGSLTATTTDSPVCSAFNFLLIEILFTVRLSVRQVTLVSPLVSRSRRSLRFRENRARTSNGGLVMLSGGRVRSWIAAWIARSRWLAFSLQSRSRSRRFAKGAALSTF